MTLKSIFKKPVNRPIEGVIKADDEARLRLEIEEYVLTNEVEKRLELFLNAYNSNEGSNGVWISGFFGSGKSHLLKILALLLENRQVEGIPTLDIFLPKCRDDAIFCGNLKLAVAIPSKSILFNIDQKASVISKTETDALLGVFVKVFNEMCGYYGKQGHIAQFERDLDSRGLYQKFKTVYENLTNRFWEKGREQALLESKNIAKAYAQVTEEDEATTVGILDKYRNQYSVSIEDFAEQVQTYLDRQSPDFRLNFFVDEVGQYIAENIKLMTNLQTIAETLATKCRGRAWVIVTAQEDMNTVAGQMSRQQSNDFSKIQARFANRMKLSSADVSEVIQKRLLTKSDDGIKFLSKIYCEEVKNFKTLFDFADGSVTYRNFQDCDHFINSYPFIPYQFALFQSAIQNLSKHNAFEGKHSSVGERSMLGVFQQVAIHIGDHPIGQLATFDLMFEGIRTALKSNIQRAILQSENHLENPLAIKLLKNLFLVKYVKEFKPTIRNLCILMCDSFSQDLPQLRKSIEAALNLLEQQTYIQRNGELYEYLSDEEKDVEQEIKNTDVAMADIAAELEKIIFEHVIKNSKMRYEENGQDYPYSKKLDNRLYSREHELTIHVISPFHENAGRESILLMQSAGRDELLVVMPFEDRLVRDILQYKKTEKYIHQNTSISQQETIRRILTEKGIQNSERYSQLQNLIKNLLGKANLFVSGNRIENGSEDVQTRLARGFHVLISRVYPNLRMLCGIAYTENSISKCLKYSHDELLGNNIISLPEPEQEMFAFIQRNKQSSLRTSLKSLVEKFEHKPNGWYYAAILCTVANLCAKGKLEVWSNGNLIEDEKLEGILRNSQGHGNVLLEPSVEFTTSQIRALKEFFENFFDKPPQNRETKDLAKETASAFQELIDQLIPLYSQSLQYQFLNTLKAVLEKLKETTGNPFAWHLTELPHQQDALLEMKEKIIDPVRKFMNGPQKNIYDSACKFMKEQEPNFSSLEINEISQISKILTDPECFRGNCMQQVKSLLDSLQDEVKAQIKAEITKAKDTVDTLKKRLCGMAEFSLLTMEQQKQITQTFSKFFEFIERQHLMAVIRDTLRIFEEAEYPRLLSRMTSCTQITPAHRSLSQGELTQELNGYTTTTTVKAIHHIEYVTSRSLQFSFDKPWLADEMDVDGYLKSMKEVLLMEIRKGKRIHV